MQAMTRRWRPQRVREPLVFPPVPPVDQVLAELDKLEAFVRRNNDRELAREHNGLPSAERDPQRVARRNAALAELPTTVCKPTTEYVLCYDDAGELAGITPAT